MSQGGAAPFQAFCAGTIPHGPTNSVHPANLGLQGKNLGIRASRTGAKLLHNCKPSLHAAVVAGRCPSTPLLGLKHATEA